MTCSNAAEELRRMKKMNEHGVGIQQVDQQACKLEANHEAKKGNRALRNMKKGFYENRDQRDSKYVQQEMNLRIGQVHQDRRQSEKKLKNLKEERLKKAKSEKE